MTGPLRYNDGVQPPSIVDCGMRIATPSQADPTIRIPQS
jgi:hypothetical protein